MIEHPGGHASKGWGLCCIFRSIPDPNPLLQRALGRGEGRPGVGAYCRRGTNHGSGNGSGNSASLHGLQLDVVVGTLQAGSGTLQGDYGALLVARLVHGSLGVVQRLGHVHGLQRMGGVTVRWAGEESLIATLAVSVHSSPADITYPISSGMYSGW